MMKNKTVLIYLCWLISIFALAGSLFFSEVMQFPPCELCWYQRICMYPLSILFLVGSYRKSSDFFYYSFPLVSIGWLVSLFHNLLHFGIIPESASPCRENVSCATVYIELFGFLTIPMMSLIAFSLLLIFLLIYKKDFLLDEK